MIFPVNTSTVLLTCEILQIYFDKLKLTGHKRYDGLLNIAEASPVHRDGRAVCKALLPQLYTSARGWRQGEGLVSGWWGLGSRREGRVGMHQTDPARTASLPEERLGSQALGQGPRRRPLFCPKEKMDLEHFSCSGSQFLFTYKGSWAGPPTHLC